MRQTYHKGNLENSRHLHQILENIQEKQCHQTIHMTNDTLYASPVQKNDNETKALEDNNLKIEFDVNNNTYIDTSQKIFVFFKRSVH